MPLNKASGKPEKWEVVKQSMMGSQANQMLKGLPELIKYIFSPDNDEQGKNITQIRGKNSKKEQDWYRVSAKFVECMNTIEEHDNIQGETLEDLEDKCNEFIHQWIKLAGPDKVTNYIHMLGAMHFTYYLRKYGNCYSFTQQGWEAVNAKIKNFYFNNTNHGGQSGRKGGKNEIGNHFGPIMNMIVRHVLWITGLGQKYATGDPVMNTGLGIKDTCEQDLNDDMDEQAVEETAQYYDGEEQEGLYDNPEEEEEGEEEAAAAEKEGTTTTTTTVTTQQQ